MLGILQDDNFYSKSVPQESEFLRESGRQRANTLSEGHKPEEIIKKPALPTVFKWDGGGRQVYISGTFSEWKALPMVKSHGDFVTIIDLPEGEHQFKVR